jgi:preprotein translocase subunit SecY
MTASLAQRIALTIGALLLFQLGEYIPLPGVNPDAWAVLAHGQGSGIAGMLAASSGGVRRLAIFALGLVPYVSAAVLVQLATIVSRRLRARARDGERGRAAMVRYARYLTVLLTAFQAWGVANGLERVNGVVTHPGPLFVLSTVLTLTGGTMFLVWLAEQITARGIGNGIALILLTGIVTELPREIATALEFMRQYRVGSEQIDAVALIVVAVTAVAVAIELARRRLPVIYSARAVGTRQLAERKADLSLKLNPAGIVPVLLASFLMSVLVAMLGFFAGFDLPLIAQLRPGNPVYLVLYPLLIIFCTFF